MGGEIGGLGRGFRSHMAYERHDGEGMRLTAREARQLLGMARRDGITAAERRFFQRKVDDFGDRMDPDALRLVSRVAGRNRPSAVRRDVRRSLLGDGLIDVAEARTVVAATKRDGASRSERRELLRQAALLGTRVGAGARRVFERFRTYADHRVGNPYNQKLPVAPGDQGNRITNRARPQAAIDFPIRPGSRLSDGLGNLRGEVVGNAVRINYGQRKTLNGEPHVYTIATRIREASGKEYRLSGWVPERALRDGPVSYMPTIAAPRPPGGDGIAYTIGTDLPDRGDLKVRPNVPRNLRMAANDYLERPSRKDVSPLVNFLYNLPGKGGVATDSFPPGTPFVRARGVRARAVTLYHPDSARVAGRMTFLYGRIGDRYGWIARDALRAPGR